MGNIYRCKSLYAQNITEIEILELRHDFYMKLKLFSSTLWLPNISSYSDLDQKIDAPGEIWDSALGTRNSCNIENCIWIWVLWMRWRIRYNVLMSWTPCTKVDISTQILSATSDVPKRDTKVGNVTVTACLESALTMAALPIQVEMSLLCRNLKGFGSENSLTPEKSTTRRCQWLSLSTWMYYDQILTDLRETVSSWALWHN